jgi:hypothetical protein
MLGAHSMKGKGNFFEEAVRVPMIMSFPGVIKEKSVVDRAVGQIDLFATILDYVGASKHDESDGLSLRRYIEDTSINDKFDERIVVAEYDNRKPVSKTKLGKWYRRLVRVFGTVLPRYYCLILPLLPKRWDAGRQSKLYGAQRKVQAHVVQKLKGRFVSRHDL